MNKNIFSPSLSSGFTLIELLVVVLIIGILSAVALPQYQRSVDKARLSQSFVWAKNLRDAQRVYYMANGEYTQKLEDLDVAFSSCTPDAGGESVGYYTCDGGWRVQLTTVPSGYVYIPKKYTGQTSAAIEYYFSPQLDRRLCLGNSDRWYKLCQGMGGVLYSDRGDTKYYQLP